MDNRFTSEYERRLEETVDRELKALPELSAPGHLISRVMAAIAARANLPWYRQSWQAWPVGLRTAALVALLAFFGGLCFGTWEVWQGATVAVAIQKVGGLFAGVGAILKAASLLLSSVLLLIKQLGAGIIIGLLVAVGLGYAMCVGLGTVYWRLASSRS